MASSLRRSRFFWVSGAADCSIMPCKVANSAGSMYFSAIQNALYWAADNGADVISMSFGAATYSVPSTDAALTYAYNAGVVMFAATGNENASGIGYPAVNSNVISVGAASPCGGRKRSAASSLYLKPGVDADPNDYTCDGERWWGSNYGSTTQDNRGAVDVIAPTIMPTTDIGGSGGYASGDYDMWFNGTSCATPYCFVSMPASNSLFSMLVVPTRTGRPAAWCCGVFAGGTPERPCCNHHRISASS